MSPPSTKPDASPLHSQSRDWLTTLEHLAHTPPSSHPGRSRVAPVLGGTTTTPSFSPIHNHSLLDRTRPASRTLDPNSPPQTPSSRHSRSCCRDQDWTAGASFNKHSFEPKNLLTMFDEAVQN